MTNPPIIEIDIAGKNYKALLDTGAERTVISLSLYEHLILNKVKLKSLPVVNMV